MTKSGTDRDFVLVDRNGIVENRHEIHAAVVDSTGKLLFGIGDPSRVTLIRSCAKPAQALAVVESGALEKYGFDEADLALSCASHSSELIHSDRAKSMLMKSHSEESDMRCGGHPALNVQVNTSWIKNDFTATPLYSNCSGKHAAFVAAAKAIGAGAEGYHKIEHPIQAGVAKVIDDISRTSPGDVKWAIDGCNMASPAMPLVNLAHFNAAFAKAADDVKSKRGASPRTEAMARIFDAMTTYPQLVAGEGRFCTLIMEAYQGMLIGKIGAEAVYGIGIRESEQTRRLGAHGAVGISVKIEDGNLDVLYAVLPEILQRLGLGTTEQLAKVDSFHRKPVVNTAGVTTGGYSFSFQLKTGEQP